MSRFEPNVEPSMEEILASIRRIIAEDTSGSRTVPPPTPTLTRQHPAPVKSTAETRPAVPQRGFMSREAFMKSSPSADDPSGDRFFKPVTPQDPISTGEAAERTVQEVRTPEPLKAETKSVEVQPVAVEKMREVPKLDVKRDAPAEMRIEPEHVAAIAEAEPNPLLPEHKADAQLIDAQLVELLGQDLKTLREADERQASSNPLPPNEAAAANIIVPAKPVLPETATLGRSANGPSPSAVAPATVPNPAAGNVTPARFAQPEPRDTADPFAFDLGPSPFLPRTSPPHAPASRGATDAAAEGHSGRMNGAPAFQEATPPTAPGQQFPEPTSVTHESGAPSPVTPTNPRPAPFAVPSVSATLGPDRQLEPLSNSFKSAPVDSQGHGERAADPFPFRTVNPSPDAHRGQNRDTLDRLLLAGHAQPVPPPPPVLPPLDAQVSPATGVDRMMEDAVADLLRPLLKTWLAENMPKIVERALRREMTERLLPGQKNPRE